MLNLARAEAAGGRFDEAHRLFDQAHGELAEIGSESFLLELDMRRAECFVLEGRYAEALELATATLEASEAAGEAGASARAARARPWLRPHPGAAAGGGARAARVGLAAARENGNDFEVALTLWALASTGRPECGQEADELFRRLGVVSVRSVPLP